MANFPKPSVYPELKIIYWRKIRSLFSLKSYTKKSGLWKADLISGVTWKPGVRRARFDCMNVVLVIKLSSTAMQGKWKVCKCHTIYFFLFMQIRKYLNSGNFRLFQFLRNYSFSHVLNILWLFFEVTYYFVSLCVFWVLHSFLVTLSWKQRVLIS